MNDSLLIAINSFAGTNRSLDHFMIFCAQDLIFIVFAIAGYGIYVSFKKKHWIRIIQFVMSLLLAFGVTEIIRNVFPSARPFSDLHLHQLITHATGKSFPSDHMVAASTLAIALGVFVKKKSGALLFILSLLIGFSRIFVGVHYPSDILASILISIVSPGIVYGIWWARTYAMNQKKLNCMQIAFLIGLVFSPLAAACAFIITYGEYSHHYATKKEPLGLAWEAALFTFITFLVIIVIVGLFLSSFIGRSM